MTDRLFRGATPDPAPAPEPEIKIENTSGFPTIKIEDGYPIWFDTRVNKFSARIATDDHHHPMIQRTTIAAVEKVIREQRPAMSVQAIDIGNSLWYSSRGSATFQVIDVQEKNRRTIYRTPNGTHTTRDTVYIATPELIQTRDEIVEAYRALEERWRNMIREAERLTPYEWNQMISQKRIEEREAAKAAPDGEVEL